jgi:hypothetical protein
MQKKPGFCAITGIATTGKNPVSCITASPRSMRTDKLKNDKILAESVKICVDLWTK